MTSALWRRTSTTAVPLPRRQRVSPPPPTNYRTFFGRLHEAVKNIQEDATTVLSSSNNTQDQLKAAASTAQGASESAAKNSTEIRATADGFRRRWVVPIPTRSPSAC